MEDNIYNDNDDCQFKSDHLKLFDCTDRNILSLDVQSVFKNLPPIYNEVHCLPSDSIYREDINALKCNNEEESEFKKND